MDGFFKYVDALTQEGCVRRVHMATFRSLTSRFAAMFRRREWNQRVDDELRFHLDMEIEENIRQGMAPTDARAAAHRKIGNGTQCARRSTT
jgi:hypothetical protein